MAKRAKVTVLRKCFFQDLTAEFLANPKGEPCPLFKEGQEFIISFDDYLGLHVPGFCSEAWEATGKYIWAAINGGVIFDGWTNDPGMMITCCNDGTRPVIFKIESID